MYIATMPLYSKDKRIYDINQIKPDKKVMSELFPEIYSCVGCNICTQFCPKGTNVMQYISYAKEGEFRKCAEESFECVECGCCSVKCPANISHSAVGLLARRLTGKYIYPELENLNNMLEQVKKGEFDSLIEQVMQKPIAEIKELYNGREFEEW